MISTCTISVGLNGACVQSDLFFAIVFFVCLWPTTASTMYFIFLPFSVGVISVSSASCGQVLCMGVAALIISFFFFFFFLFCFLFFDSWALTMAPVYLLLCV